jgi:uncharacterized membrane protein YhhN
MSCCNGLRLFLIGHLCVIVVFVHAVEVADCFSSGCSLWWLVVVIDCVCLRFW